MEINSRTKIAAILRHHPGALEAIARISPGFEKLRNPILRKILAGRTSLAMASRIGNCELSDFYTALAPLGFTVHEEPPATAPAGRQHYFFPAALNNGPIAELDVRPVLAGGKDPLKQILEKIKQLRPGETLKIINSFEPAPLISLLEKQGFVSFTDTRDPDTVETYFFKDPNPSQGNRDHTRPNSNPSAKNRNFIPPENDSIPGDQASIPESADSPSGNPERSSQNPDRSSEIPGSFPGNPDFALEAISTQEGKTEDWDTVLNRFGSRTQKIDVRQLEMPLPMITILEALDKLPEDTALFVYHKRVPVFLIPELNSRGLGYRIREISEGNVQMMIFKE